MGMYDYIKCAYPLPDPRFQGREFQTKDLDCELKLYEITREGMLVKNEHDLEEIPEEEKKPGQMFPVFRIRVGSKRRITIPYDSDLFFYDFMVEDDIESQWIEFRARFEEGKLLSIKQVKGQETQGERA